MSKLPASFYQNTDILFSTKALLGKKVCTQIDGIFTSGIITEAEAYRGLDDKACHAYGGKRTPKSEAMYLAGGHAYVYICYGIHHLFNIVVGPPEKAEVVLIRAVEPVDGIEHMHERRKIAKLKQLTNGPGKCAAALAIHKSLNAISMTAKDTPIWLEEGISLSDDEIITGPRVGLTTAEEAMNWPWRYRIKDNPFNSKPDRVFYEGFPY